ncbi:MAG: hypothetical protein Q4G68_03970 [Planctomycetia bacterium]|nr:hypothetical protein [Planctomycetia bacterium]
MQKEPYQEKEHFPIVVVHCGNSRALELCLRQARKMNPDNPIYLVGDESNNCYDFVIHRNVDEPELSTDIAAFCAVYQGYSMLPAAWERFNMERWLLVRNLMRVENLPACLAIDSDVFLFCNVDEEARRFKDYAMTFAHWDDARNLIHCNFIQNRRALDSFCDYMFQVYTDANLLNLLKEKNCKRRAARHTYWVSDMSLFCDWNQKSNEKTCFFEDFLSEGICYDSCIDSDGVSHNFQTQFYLPGLRRRHKKITFVNGVPYSVLRNGQKVPMKCLHYHGYFKFLMEDHFQGRHSKWKTFGFLLRRSLLNIPEKLRNFAKRLLGRM